MTTPTQCKWPRNREGAAPTIHLSRRISFTISPARRYTDLI
jgi:hypothetical protein